MQISNLFSLSYWLDPTVLDHRAGPAMWLVVAAGLAWLAAGALSLTRFGRVPRDICVAAIASGALAVLVAVGRLYAISVLGLRAGWLLAALIMAAPIALRVARQAARDGLPGDALRATAFAQEQAEARSWHPSTVAAWIGLHLVGLVAVLNTLRWPLVLAPILMAATLAPCGISYAIRRLSRRSNLQSSIANLILSALAPFVLVYAVLLVRVLVALATQVMAGEYRVVEPFGALLNLSLVLVVMSAYALAIGFQRSSFILHPSSFVKRASLALVAITFTWAGWTAWTLHTHGVTGSDPYAYAQMGVDLAERGTVFHAFSLVRVTHDLGIPTDPIVHVGYRLPQDIQRTSTTVWPPGYAVFTGLAYRLTGEIGLYLITPFLSLLSLLAVGWLTHRVLRIANWETGAPYAICPTVVVALTIFLTATSYQQVEWQLIPMADIAAQLFSILALALAIRTQASGVRGQGSEYRTREMQYGAAFSGVCLGIAFSIRYTQVLIAPALALALLTTRSGRGETKRSSLLSPLSSRLWLIAVCAFSALLAAAPVLIYHTAAFGSPLHTGSEEWSNFSLARLPETLGRILAELNSPREYGLLTPLMAIGLLAMWRYNRRAVWVLLLYFAPLFAFHIVYWPLRLRDILSLFPVISFLAALGAAWLVRSAYRIVRIPDRVTDAATTQYGICTMRYALPAAILVLLCFAFVLRSMDTLMLPVTRGFGAFGYLVREQRASFARVAELTPPDAVIGCTLNSGAVDLYSDRQTFRPASWSVDEMLKFVHALRAERRPVYILADGAQMEPAVETLRRHFLLGEVARLDMPYYFPGSGSENRKVPLYRIGE